MADSKISELLASATMADTDYFPAVIGGVTKRVTKAVLSGQLSVNSQIIAATARDQKSAATHGGTFNSGGWRTRTLNEGSMIPGSGISLSNDRLTLPAGTWLIMWSAPAYQVNNHKTRLRINGAGDHLGQAVYASINSASSSQSQGAVLGSRDAAFTAHIEHFCEMSKTDVGMGVAAAFGYVEVYSRLTAIRLADPALSNTL